MPKPFATLRDETELELQDSGNALWAVAEINQQLLLAIKEASEYQPEEVMLTYEFESRSGTATSTTAGSLVDATNGHFTAADVGKVIFDVTDNDWAVVVTFTDANTLVLSKDIFVSGDDYRMYNRDCWNIKQIYIGDVEDFIGDDRGVFQVEFPIRRHAAQFRGFTVRGRILEVDYEGGIPDSGAAGALVQVNVWINRHHQVSQMTDLVGAVDLVAGYSAGDTQIVVDALTTDEVIAEDQEFTVAGLRDRYRVTEAVTIAGSEAIVNFWPPLENDLANNDVVTFTDSTLPRRMERLIVQLAAGRAALSKGATYLRSAATATTSLANAGTALGLIAAKVLKQVTDLNDGRMEAAKATEAMADADKGMAEMGANIDQAISTLDAARPLINTVTLGQNVGQNYAAQAATELAASRARLDVARGHMTQAAANPAVAGQYVAIGAGELEGATVKANEATAYMQKAAIELTSVDRTREFSFWGRDKKNEAIAGLKTQENVSQIIEYPRSHAHGH